MIICFKNISRTISVSVLICCVFISVGDGASFDEETDDGSHRELRFNQESWHAIRNEPEGASGWIPGEPTNTQQGVTTIKRRRLRKRKRRPPILSYATGDSVVEVAQPTNTRQEDTEPSNDQTALLSDRFDQAEEHEQPKRRKRPGIMRETWDEVQEESIRPYVRRKVAPAFEPSDETGLIENSDFDASAYQGPAASSPSFGATKKQPHAALNLKTLLKQNGGLSLSEILQRKNLTLKELLEGKQEAIEAIADSSEDLEPTSESSGAAQKRPGYSENHEGFKYKRMPPSVAMRKENINRRYEKHGDSRESFTEEEMLEAQRKRLALLKGHAHKTAQDGKFAEVTRYAHIAEPTTEKRIFVPAHPNLYTSVDYKPELSELPEIRTEPHSKTEFTIATPTQKPPTSTTTEYTASTKGAKTHFAKSSKPSGLPITSAKLNKMVTKRVSSTQAPIEEENYPVTFKPMKISVKDILRLQSSHNEAAEKVSDEPLRMSIDLDAPPFAPTVTTQQLTSSSTSTTTSSPPPTTQQVPKLKPISARNEILEILKDPLGRAKLAKILEERSMTIQELIDQRERGSSQRHLADIFHNKTKEPEPSDEPLEGRISGEVFTSFPVFARQPKALLRTETSSVSSPLSSTSFPSFKIEVSPDRTKTNRTFLWKQLYPDLFDLQDKNIQEKPTIRQEVMSNRIEQEQTDLSSEIVTQEDIHRMEDSEERSFSSVSSEQLNFADPDKHKIIRIPSGVQSAIAASLVIVGSSLTVFVAILIFFRWTQKRRMKLKYFDSLRPPLFDVKPRKIKTFVADTFGKSKFSFHRNNAQNVNDVWEKTGDEKNQF